MVDQSAEISVTNVNARTRQISAKTPATPTFVWAIVIVTELKTQLGNTSTGLNVQEDSMNCFSRNVSNAMPQAKLALTFETFVTERQIAMITSMKQTALALEKFLIFFHLIPK